METNRQRVERLAASKKGNIDDCTFFTAKRTIKVLSDMVRGILLKYSLKRTRTEIIWSSPEMTGYTDHKKIVINANCSVFDGLTRKGRWLGIKGLAIHESAHLLYTNQKYFLSVVNALEQGRLIPKPSKEITMFDVSNKNFLILYKHIWNSLEDGYIEYRFLEEFSYKLYQQALNLLRKLHIKSFSSLEEMIDNEKCEKDKLLTILNLLLAYCKYGKLIIDKKSDMNDIRVATLIDCMPYINEYNENPDIHERYRALNEIIVLLEPLIAEYLTALDNNQTDMENLSHNTNDADNTSQSETGAANSQSESSAEQAPSSPPSASSQPQQSADESTNEESSEESSNGDSSDDESEDSEEQQKAGNDGNDENEDEEGESTTSSNESTDKEEMEENNSPSDESSDEDSSSQMSGDLGLGDTSFDECVADGESIQTVEEIEAEIPDDVEAEMERLNEKIAEDVAEEELEEEHLKELQDFDRNLDYGQLHKAVNSKINRVTSVSDDVKESYNSVGKEPERVGKATSRLLKQVLKDRRSGGVQKGLYFGKSLSQSSYHRKDKRFFENKKLPTESPRLAVALVIDESGSMYGEKIDYARFMAITTYTFCQELGINVAIMGHSTNDYEVEIFQYTDFDGSYDNADKYRLMNIQDRNCNRDGYALKYAVEKIKKVDSDVKLVIVVSDGQPNHQGYQGQVAFDDLRKIKSDAKKSGIDVVAAAIDEDKEIIKSIYGEGFLNISNLKRLPQAITNTIKKYLPAV